MAVNVQVNPLESLIQGFQVGQQLTPAALQQRNLSNQLALQLQQIQVQKAQQQLNDLLNPDAALSRQLRAELAGQSLSPMSGIVPVPVEVGASQIATPGAITQEQQNLLEAGQIASDEAGLAAPTIPTARAGVPITPFINPLGQPTGFGRDIESAIANTEALTRARGSSALDRLLLSNAQREADRLSREGIAGAANLTRQNIATIRAGSSSQGRGLTPNQQMLTLRKAGESGINPDDPKYLDPNTGTYDFTRLTIDSGKAARDLKAADNQAKASGLTGKAKSDIEALNAAERQLNLLQDEITAIANSGNTPGFLDNLIAAETSSPPGGWLSSGWQQLLKNVQSEESKELEGKKAIISSALTKAISGLAVTQQEAQRLGFLPRAGESFEEVVRKAAVLQDYINNQRSGLGQGSTIAPSTPTTTAPQSSAPIQIRSIRRRP